MPAVELSGKVASLQVGPAGTVPFRGNDVRTGIFKTPVEGPVALGEEGFAGDVQVDRRYHGGPDKAVCVHPAEHRPDWETLVGQPLPPGAFGENLSTTGLLETTVHVGDTFTLGTAVVQVSQPRGPCFKLAARWRSKRLPAAMAREGRSGWYFRVLETGDVQAGDELWLTDRVSDVSIAEIMRVTYSERGDAEALHRVAAVPELAQDWRGAIGF